MTNLKKNLLMFTAIAIAITGLTACNTSEDDVVKVTPTPTARATATADVVDTTADADATVTDVPSVENTPEAQATASATVAGEATAQPSATGSETGEGTGEGNTTSTPTATAKPTSTVKPSATATPKKTAAKTATPKPTATATPKKTATATKKPTATAKKTATPKPTATAQKAVYQTIEFEGKTYKVLMGRNGNPNLIKDYSTLPEVLQAYACPTFDKEAIMMDIYKYAKTKGFKYFYNPNVPLLKESSIGDTNYPDAFVPGGNMTEELALEAFSWNSPYLVTYLGDDVYADKDYEYTELDDILLLQSGLKAMARRLAEKGMDGLCLWIRDYGDSTYRKTYWDNGLYNGKVTKEYAIYFMYGGCTDLVQKIEI